MLFGGPGVDPRTTFSFTFFTLPLSGDPWRSQRRQKTPADTKMTLKWTPRLTKKTTKPTPRLTKQLRKILSTTAQDNTTITSDAFDTLMHPCPSQRIMDPPIEGTVAGWPAGLLDKYHCRPPTINLMGKKHRHPKSRSLPVGMLESSTKVEMPLAMENNPTSPKEDAQKVLIYLLSQIST